MVVVVASGGSGSSVIVSGSILFLCYFLIGILGIDQPSRILFVNCIYYIVILPLMYHI